MSLYRRYLLGFTLGFMVATGPATADGAGKGLVINPPPALQPVQQTAPLCPDGAFFDGTGCRFPTVRQAVPVQPLPATPILREANVQSQGLTLSDAFFASNTGGVGVGIENAFLGGGGGFFGNPGRVVFGGQRGFAGNRFGARRGFRGGRRFGGGRRGGRR